MVRALRLAGHDVLAVTEVSAGSEDQVVIDFSVHESRILLTEDKDFDNWFMPADGPQRAFSSSDSQKRHERRFVGLGRKAISWLAGLSSCSPVEYASAQSQKVKARSTPIKFVIFPRPTEGEGGQIKGDN